MYCKARLFSNHIIRFSCRCFTLSMYMQCALLLHKKCTCIHLIQLDSDLVIVVYMHLCTQFLLLKILRHWTASVISRELYLGRISASMVTYRKLQLSKASSGWVDKKPEKRCHHESKIPFFLSYQEWGFNQ